MWRWVVSLAALCAVALGLQSLLFTERPLNDAPPAVSLPTHAFVISLYPAKGSEVAAHVQKHLDLSSVTVIAANTGDAELPLYTRNLIDEGRIDHMQIGNRPMVGCLLSHASIWAKVDRWTYVFEDDAVLHSGSRAMAQWLVSDIQDLPWSILMLQERSYIADGAYTPIGKFASTCANCTWFGTRGYIINARGAETLLKYVHPIVVQVDSLIGLVNKYDESFHMYWTRHEIVGLVSRLQTTVWDGCLRCYSRMPWILGAAMGCCCGWAAARR
jgi:GR25 family glycosyltransferase involved in LPS biosynthesis